MTVGYQYWDPKQYEEMARIPEQKYPLISSYARDSGHLSGHLIRHLPPLFLEKMQHVFYDQLFAKQITSYVSQRDLL